MWTGFVRWWFRRATYPSVVVSGVLATTIVVIAVLWIERGDGVGWFLLCVGVFGLVRAAADLAYRRHHKPKSWREKREEWLGPLS